MSHYLVQEVKATSNVEVLTGTAVVGGGGEGHLQELVLRESASAEERRVAADALFVLIGARPHTGWLPAEIATDRHGFLLTGDDVPDHNWHLERRPLTLETSMPNVLAVGDVRHGSVKRVASAVGEGSVAVQLIHNFLTNERLHPTREHHRSAIEIRHADTGSRSGRDDREDVSAAATNGHSQRGAEPSMQTLGEL